MTWMTLRPAAMSGTTTLAAGGQTVQFLLNTETPVGLAAGGGLRGGGGGVR